MRRNARGVSDLGFARSILTVGTGADQNDNFLTMKFLFSNSFSIEENKCGSNKSECGCENSHK